MYTLLGLLTLYTVSLLDVFLINLSGCSPNAFLRPGNSTVLMVRFQKVKKVIKFKVMDVLQQWKWNKPRKQSICRSTAIRISHLQWMIPTERIRYSRWCFIIIRANPSAWMNQNGTKRWCAWDGYWILRRTSGLSAWEVGGVAGHLVKQFGTQRTIMTKDTANCRKTVTSHNFWTVSNLWWI